MVSETDWLRWLEAKAPTLFIIAGGLYVFFAVDTLLATYTGTSYPVAMSIIAPVGKVSALLGVIGLYPALVERRPNLARVGTGFAIVPAVGWFIIAIGGSLEAVGLISGHPEPIAILPFVLLGTRSLVFGLIGVTVLLANVHHRAVGVFLLLSACMFPLWILSPVPAFLIDFGNVAGFLGVGVTLMTAGVPSDGVETPADPTA